MNKETILCYCGKDISAKAIEVGATEKDLYYIYHPKSGIIVLASTKGTTINASKHSPKRMIEYMQKGEKTRVSKKYFNDLINKCEEINEDLSLANKLFDKCKRN